MSFTPQVSPSILVTKKDVVTHIALKTINVHLGQQHTETFYDGAETVAGSLTPPSCDVVCFEDGFDYFQKWGQDSSCLARPANYKRNVKIPHLNYTLINAWPSRMDISDNGFGIVLDVQLQADKIIHGEFEKMQPLTSDQDEIMVEKKLEKKVKKPPKKQVGTKSQNWTARELDL